MALPIEQVKKIAHLARIKMSEQELNKHAQELDKIFNWVEQLHEVNTDNTEPLFSIESHTLPMRDDVVTGSNIRDQILSNCPQSGKAKYGYFVVPKVVE